MADFAPPRNNVFDTRHSWIALVPSNHCTAALSTVVCDTVRLLSFEVGDLRLLMATVAAALLQLC